MNDDEGLKMKYFVVKPHGTDAYATASRAALRAYAESIRKENPNLACDLNHWERVAELQCRADWGEFGPTEIGR